MTVVEHLPVEEAQRSAAAFAIGPRCYTSMCPRLLSLYDLRIPHGSTRAADTFALREAPDRWESTNFRLIVRQRLKITGQAWSEE